MAGVTLAGTLTRPNRPGRAAAVLLIPGSGSQDRDEALCGHRPFLVLADHLTRCGVVVLRLDDRGVGGSTGDKDGCGHEELLADVRIALDFLASHSAVDAARLGLIGHSEGACLASAAAGLLSDVAFVVLMACGAGRGEDGLHEQWALIARMAGATEEQIAHERRMNDAVFDILKSRLDSDAAQSVIRPVFARFLRSWPGTSSFSDAEAESDGHVERMTDIVLAGAFRYFLTCDFGAYLQRVRCPVLALYGEFNLQVPPLSHLPRLRDALAMAGNTQVIVEEFPGLNHLFQTATTGAVSEYEEMERLPPWSCSRSRRGSQPSRSGTTAQPRRCRRTNTSVASFPRLFAADCLYRWADGNRSWLRCRDSRSLPGTYRGVYLGVCPGCRSISPPNSTRW